MDLLQILVYIEVLIGVLVAAWIYLDMRNAGKVEPIWPVIGLLLGPIGALLYYVVVKQRRGEEFSYPPAPRYEKPEYRRKEERGNVSPPEDVPSDVPEKVVESIEGIPRCPHCGAAISSRDWECAKCGAQLKRM
jgi:hypothetical protein